MGYLESVGGATEPSRFTAARCEKSGGVGSAVTGSVSEGS